MSDYRNTFINAVSEELVTIFDKRSVDLAMQKIVRILNDYEIAERCTEVTVPCTEQNEKAIRRYCACLALDGKSERTIYAYRRQIRIFLAFVQKPVNRIDTYDIRYFLATEKERGISDRSVENTRSYLSAFFQWLSLEDVIPKNPCAKINPVKYINKERMPFSAVEIDTLRHACLDEEDRAMVEILLTSGVRVSELSDMNVTDINLTDMSVHVRNGKGKKERVTYIDDVARSHLKKYLALRDDNHVALFVGQRGIRLKSDGIRIRLKKIAARAKVQNVHPHRFRRTFATGLAARGMAVQDIQKLLGHTNIATTMEYICIDSTRVKASYQQYIA